VVAPAGPPALERQADAIRERLGGEVDELGRRGRDALDLRLQLRRHPGKFAAAGALLVAGAVGRILWGLARRRQARGWRGRLRRLWAGAV
jgi:hypothetical protein